MRQRSVWVIEYKHESTNPWRVHDECIAFSTSKPAKKRAEWRAKQYTGTEYRVVRYDASK